jgi:hypothetical protein
MTEVGKRTESALNSSKTKLLKTELISMLNTLELKPGEEQYETYYSPTAQKHFIHYNYRSPKGGLFSCSGKTLEECRDLCKKFIQHSS